MHSSEPVPERPLGENNSYADGRQKEATNNHPAKDLVASSVGLGPFCFVALKETITSSHFILFV